MNTFTETETRLEARNSFTGKSLTDAQFDEGWQLAGVLERGIRKSGSFHEKLTDYAFAFARSERFDQMRAETIIRDLFKSRYGQTMNQMREDLMAREADVRGIAQDDALQHAQTIPVMIQDGETMPFYQAFDRAALNMAEQHNISEVAAKTMMKEAFERAESRDLYAVGKEAEQEFHQPKREAERAARNTQRNRPSRSAPARHA